MPDEPTSDPSQQPGQQVPSGNYPPLGLTQPPYAGPPPAYYGTPPPGYYQPPKKRKVWPWVLLGVFVLFFGGCGAFVIAVGSSLDSEKPTVSSGSGTIRPDSGGPAVTPGTVENKPADSGLRFQGQQERDTAANAGDAVTVDGVTTTASPLFDTTRFGSRYICTTVTIKNDSQKSQSFNVWDWKLQDANGTARNSSFTGTDNQLNSGEVAAGGGTTVGDVCFDNPQGSPSGTYVVLFDPSFIFTSDRIGWINVR